MAAIAAGSVAQRCGIPGLSRRLNAMTNDEQDRSRDEEIEAWDQSRHRTEDLANLIAWCFVCVLFIPFVGWLASLVW